VTHRGPFQPPTFCDSSPHLCREQAWSPNPGLNPLRTRVFNIRTLLLLLLKKRYRTCISRTHSSAHHAQMNGRSQAGGAAHPDEFQHGRGAQTSVLTNTAVGLKAIRPACCTFIYLRSVAPSRGLHPQPDTPSTRSIHCSAQGATQHPRTCTSHPRPARK